MTALQQVSIAPVRSFWLQQALAAESEAQSAEPLAVDHVCDICIVGGGYTGLWTALRLKSLDPTVSVTVVEADICGGGASGRNGGLVLSWWAKFKLLLAWYGEAEAIRLATATASAIDEMDDFLIANQIDAHVNKGGILRTAAATAQIGKIEPTVVACEQRGIDVFQRLTANEVAQRAGSSTYIGGVYERQAATVQPALLARGLRRVALQCGVQIFEQTPVIEILGGVNPRLRTRRGVIRAEKVLLATNAWMANLPEIRRAVVVLSSDMVVTAPISGRLKEAGWNGGECITDGRLMVHYHQVTREGRVAIGRGSGGTVIQWRVRRFVQSQPEKGRCVCRRSSLSLSAVVGCAGNPPVGGSDRSHAQRTDDF